jgi:uncharacterized membrane protein
MKTPSPGRGRAEQPAVDRLVSVVLRGGVLIAATVTAAGGAVYLANHGAESVHYGVFAGEPASLRSLAGIVRGAAALNGKWIIAFGLLLLVATPIARVTVLLIAFLRERDRLYVVVSAVVLAVLLIGVIGGNA